MTNAAFLQACLRLRIDPDGIAALRAGAGSVANWRALLAEADAERVAPLLHGTVGDRGILPAELTDALRQRYRQTALRNMLILRELAACLRALTAAAVPVVVLKGAVLAEVVYANVALRPMGDVDLLVRRDDLPAARGAIERLGYSLGRTETHPGVLADYENELALRKPGAIDTWIDLHWSLFDSPHHQRHVAMEWFWRTAEPVQIGGIRTLTLGAEATLIHLCGHLALHHASTGLLWWHDVAEVVAARRGSIDWGELLSRAQQYDLLVPVRTVLCRVAEEWGAPVPLAVVENLRSRPPSRAEEQALTRLADHAAPAGQRLWADLRSIPDWHERLRFARTNVFPSAAYMQQRYGIRHRLLLPFYYPWRWLRGLLGMR